jgi:carboxylate-amine ligase
MLEFKSNEKALTLGVEMEMQILDRDTLLLTPRSPEILKLLTNRKLAKEMFRSTLEVITDVCDNVHDVVKDLRETMVHVNKAAEKLGMRFAGTGTNPLADYHDRVLSATPRYHELLDRNQWLIRRMAVYGLHIHIGLRSGEECIRLNNFFLRFVPHLIALSGSSPFWRGYDTGLSSARPTMYEAHPTSGLPYLSKDWNDFNRVYQAMVQTGSIESVRDIWWDLRPSPGYGTLELRMCDGPASMLELEAIVAFVHLLAHWFAGHNENYFSDHSLIPERWILRENKWRAIRYGTHTTLIDHETLEVKSLKTVMEEWQIRLQPYIAKLGYEKQMRDIAEIVERGNSSARQCKILHSEKPLTKEEKSDPVLMKQLLMKVVEHNVNEFEQGEPIWL